MPHPSIITITVSFITALIAWGFAREKTKQEIRSLKIDNDVKTANYYRGLVDDLSIRLKSTLDELKVLEGKYKTLLNNHNEMLASNQELIEQLRKYKQLRKDPVK